MAHQSVLSKEVIEGLDLKENAVFVDATLGSGGHSLLICEKLNKKVEIVGLDQDRERIAESEQKLEGAGCNTKLFLENFRNIDRVLEKIPNKKVDAILYDLGLNSEQLENSGRGFSFKKDEPLLMNLGEKSRVTAGEILNEWQEESIKDILLGYGEERFAKAIAKKILEQREIREIKTTKDLVEIVERAVPGWYKRRKTHFATKTFQALRIAVNDELEALKESLPKSFESLSVGGKIAVISFHSLEDRIVKNFFKKIKAEGLGKILNKKPIIPSKEEIKENPRSRSAKLRVIEKINQK